MAGVTDHKEYTLKPGIKAEAWKTPVDITINANGGQVVVPATYWVVHFGKGYFLSVEDNDFTAAFQEAP